MQLIQTILGSKKIIRVESHIIRGMAKGAQ